MDTAERIDVLHRSGFPTHTIAAILGANAGELEEFRRDPSTPVTVASGAGPQGPAGPAGPPGPRGPAGDATGFDTFTTRDPFPGYVFNPANDAAIIAAAVLPTDPTTVTYVVVIPRFDAIPAGYQAAVHAQVVRADGGEMRLGANQRCDPPASASGPTTRRADTIAFLVPAGWKYALVGEYQNEADVGAHINDPARIAIDEVIELH